MPKYFSSLSITNHRIMAVPQLKKHNRHCCYLMNVFFIDKYRQVL